MRWHVSRLPGPFVNRLLIIHLSQTNPNITEGFGGKRALGFLLKSEICQKRSKFCMEFCLGALNSVLCVYLLRFALFLKYYVCKKPDLLSRQHDGKDNNFTLNPAKY